ncbi:MAG: DUF5134 domain-containing protein [Streptosporangiaceae bacterium]|jgi:hypothetical protein
MTPAWILDIFAAVMLVVAGVSGTRVLTAWLWRREAHPAVDVAHVLMGISMAGMLAPRLRTLPDAAWEVIFGLLTAWFGWQVVRDARAAGVRALAGGHYAPHLVHSAAMLYMYLALVTSSGTGSGMGAMGGTVTQSLSYPTLAFVFGLILAGYCVWDLDQLSDRRYSLANAASALASPALAGVPAGSVAAVLPGAAASSRDRTDVAPSRTRPGNRDVARGLLLSPGTAVSCRIAMGVTMALILFVMI